MKKFCFTLFLLFSSTCFASERQTLDLTKYQGKVIYLDFWASWCIPCRKSFPWLNQIKKQHSSDDFVVIAVNLDKKRALANEFLKKYPASFEVIYNPTGDLAKKYQIKGMPSSIIFDKNGTPQFAHKGFFPKKMATYENEIAQLINNQ